MNRAEHAQELNASKWAAELEHPTPHVQRGLAVVYGTDDHVIRERVDLLRQVIARFLERYGDRPVRVFRSPGRINLRGMHVDTHGGWLNLMTHHREVVAALATGAGPSATFVNTNPRFDEVSFPIEPAKTHPAFEQDWLSFIMHPEVRAKVEARRGHWGHYLNGCILSVQHRFPDRALTGLSAVLGSDVPRGAALSSSAALCTAVTLATLACNGLSLDGDALIQAARDAEWFTGSRCGLSDQAAMVLGGRGQLVNVALHPVQVGGDNARRMPFPDALRVLVINSHTERSLSGAALVDYTRNRFAYSLALEILRQEMRREGIAEEIVARMNRLSNLTPDRLDAAGGADCLLRLLRSVPDVATISDLDARYNLPGLHAAYDQYFAAAPAELRPTRIRLRGPLLFGVAESERARLFFDALQSEDYARAGQFMTIGHDGDRRVYADRSPFEYDVSDAALDGLIAARTPIELCPGAYEASSLALDVLVDAALDAGALGASLTGAGIAGAVLALCRVEDAPRVADAVRRRIAAPDYARLARCAEPLSAEEIRDAVVVNTATDRAGELVL